MKPVFQTVIDEVRGNCLPACIASLLEWHIDDVPHFLDRITWLRQYQSWLGGLGYQFEKTHEQPTSGYYIAALPSVMEGRTHAVIASAGRVVFDPNPRSEISKDIKPKCYYRMIGR